MGDFHQNGKITTLHNLTQRPVAELEGELIDLGVKNGIVDKAGAWYSYNGDRIGQGKDNVRNFLKENPEIAQDIDQQLRAKLLDIPTVPDELPDNVESIESAG